ALEGFSRRLDRRDERAPDPRHSRGEALADGLADSLRLRSPRVQDRDRITEAVLDLRQDAADHGLPEPAERGHRVRHRPAERVTGRKGGPAHARLERVLERLERDLALRRELAGLLS